MGSRKFWEGLKGVVTLFECCCGFCVLKNV